MRKNNIKIILKKIAGLGHLQRGKEIYIQRRMTQAKYSVVFRSLAALYPSHSLNLKHYTNDTIRKKPITFPDGCKPAAFQRCLPR